MSKYLKKYNEITGEWELITPDISVTQVLTGDTKITDTNIIVNAKEYIKETGETNLNETLTTINEDISKLKRNVSWLAEHGGNGGSGGGGTSASYGIVVDDVNDKNEMYVNTKKFKIRFMITGGTGEEYLQACNYTYDNKYTSLGNTVETNKYIEVSIDNTDSSIKNHSMTINAINPFGGNIRTKTITIYESTLSFELDKSTSSYDKETSRLNIMLDNLNANVPTLLTNGIINSYETINATYGTGEKYVEVYTGYTSTTSVRNIDLPLWKVVNREEIQGGEIIDFTAIATVVKEGVSIEPVSFTQQIKFINPSDTTIIVNINGKNEEEIEVPIDNLLSYGFKTYCPAGTSYLYYAVMIENSDGQYKLLMGEYYDDNHLKQGKKLDDNDRIEPEITKLNQYYLSNSSNFKVNIGDTITLSVKVWPNNKIGSPKEEKIKLKVIKYDSSIFQKQIPSRQAGADHKDTLFASWDNTNMSSQNPYKWNSKIEGYNFMLSEYSAETSANLDLLVYNYNNESGIKTAPNVPYLRLQNKAYAKIDFSSYENEIKYMTSHNNNYGFTISFSYMSDYHSDENRTLFLWGKNNANGELQNGIKINTNKVYWKINGKKSGANIIKELQCNVSVQTRNTIDFTYLYSNNTAKALIYINGILNTAYNFDYISAENDYAFPNEAYICCDNINGACNFSDANIYEINIFTKSLNNLETVINSKNSRLTGKRTDNDVIEDYKNWMFKNLIEKDSDNKPISKIIDNGSFKESFNNSEINDIAQKIGIPTIAINFYDERGMEKNFFYQKYTQTEITGTTFSGSVEYFSYNSSTQSTDTIKFECGISLQGTSTLGYRMKNLELYVNETFTNKDGITLPKLFQPKEDWFPESQFTLKADVVDSSHANNTVLGEWINHTSILGPNPAMQKLTSDVGTTKGTRPRDVDDQGNEKTHMSEDSSKGEISYDEKVTIKHTLEGFPILLFIKFKGEKSYTFCGIYSFNLGRYSYYNMGINFLKSFSRRNEYERKSCPAIINYYEKSDELGDINVGDIYSYEFDNEANSNSKEHPLWSQYDVSILKYIGGFKYPTNIIDSDWKLLSESLFEGIAKWKIVNPTYFTNIYPYKYDNGYVKTGDKWIEQNNESTDNIAIDANNASAYFIIANAFGMTDSLGKNLTLRTWDKGKTWYTCFYDMDTALGVDNKGDESTPITALIDRYSTIVDDDKKTTNIKIDYHYYESSSSKEKIESDYSSYLNKLWAMLRDSVFLTQKGKKDDPYYEYKWNFLRSTDGELSTSSKFTNLMESKIGTCGELIYDYDYNSKYIQDTTELKGITSAINFLHGTRIEYVKDWLKKHFYFLDGVFDKDALTTKFTYSDAPYYVDTFDVSYQNSNKDKLVFIMNTTTPGFISYNIGGGNPIKYYLDTPNKDYTIYTTDNPSASAAQLNFNGSSILAKLDGLSYGFKTIGSSTVGSAKSLCSIDFSNSFQLSDKPLENFETLFIKDNYSALEKINLSNTKLSDKKYDFSLILSNLSKIYSIDISNSDIKNISFPKTSLENLNITNSSISSFEISGQNKLTEFNFDGCDNLYNISIKDCSGVKSLNINSKSNLNNIKIDNCNSLSGITISNNYALEKIEINNCENLKNIIIEKCYNKNLEITIIGTPSLEKISFSDILYASKTITLPNTDALSNVTSFIIKNCPNINGWKFNNTEIDKYEDYPVYDLTPLTSLSGENLKINKLTTLKYLRLPNNENNPFNFYKESITDCSDLTRIFGHIKLCNSGIFNNFKNFGLNDDATNIGLTPEFKKDKYYTNIKYGTADISNMFSSTNCTINDVYYALHMCDSTITNISGLFNGCTNVIVNPINENTFKKCTNVTNINNVLGGGCHINGVLPKNLFETIDRNIEEFINVLSGDYGSQAIESSFFSENNHIKKIVGFNPIAYQMDGKTESYFKDEYILKSLPLIEVIEDSFNNCMVNLNSGKYDATELFKHNTELKVIKNSFNADANHSWIGTFRNIFGGYGENEEYFYPRKLEQIIRSFNITTGSHAQTPLFEGDERGNGVLLPLGNSFLKNIANSIEYITGRYPKENRTYEINSNYIESQASFGGTGILKYIANYEYGEYITRDCSEGTDFPYDILKDCKKLKEFPCLFENVYNYKNTGNGVIIPIEISLPNNIFANAPNIENISCAFANMHSSITCTLESKCLKGNKIINASRLFDMGSNQNFKYNIKGNIPYGLLYQEISGTTNSISGLTYQDALSYGINPNIANTYAYIDSLTGISIDTEYIVLNDENNSYKISKYRLSGYTENRPIWEKLDFTIEGTLTSLVTSTTYSSETIHKINPTIVNLQNAFSGWESSALTAYTATINSYEDLVEDNPDYDPILYVLDDELNYKINEHCNPFKKKWNKYVFDNTVNFNDYLSSTDILNKKDSYGNDIVNHSLMPEEFTPNFVAPLQASKLDKYCLGFDDNFVKLAEKGDETKISNLICTNYFCSPDILRYCSDKYTISINNLFLNSSVELSVEAIGGTETFFIKGLRGTIPSFIFEPLSNILELKYIFAGDKLLYPYKWHSYNAEGTETTGVTYPPKLFNNNKNLENISGIFSGNRIWGRTVIPLILFAPIRSNLKDISYLWENAVWIENEAESQKSPLYKDNIVYQLPEDIFSMNNNIKNATRLLSSNKYSVYRIYKIFTINNHKNLSNCTELLYDSNNTHGNVPELWDFLSRYPGTFIDFKQAFKGMNTSNIENYNPEKFTPFV